MKRLLRLSTAIPAIAFLLAGCGMPPSDPIAVPVGPTPQIIHALEAPLQCVASQLTPEAKRVSFTVLEIPDRTGTFNFSGGNDASGFANTQGAADIAATILQRAGLTQTELGPSYRNLVDWITQHAAQKLIGNGRLNTFRGPDGKSVELAYIPLFNGTIFPAKYAITGAITTTDALPGGEIGGGAYGANLSVYKNAMLIRVDLRVVELPIAGEVGGKVIAATSIQTEATQGGVQLALSRYAGPMSGPTLVNFNLGASYRTPVKLATGRMLDVGIADLLSQVFGITNCGLTDTPKTGS